MKMMRQAISLEEAQQKIQEITIKSKIANCLLSECLAEILAEDIYAPFSLPAFRRSGYDGYGISAADDHGFPKTFQVVEQIGAGNVYEKTLRPNQAVRIMTGAMVPDGVDKIIMLEKTKPIEKDKVLILESERNSNITPIGEEFKQGELLLAKGSQLNAGGMSLLAAFGYQRCLIKSKPKVAILATGSELLSPGEPIEIGKIYNSNSMLLAGLVKENGGIVSYMGTIEDNREAIEQQFHQLAKEVDVILTTGGVSVGDFDFLAAIAVAQDTCLFNKLAMRPGSPTTAFVFEQAPVLALSGNPGACFTGFYLLVEPLLQRYRGLSSKMRQTKMKLAEAYTKTTDFDRYVRGITINNTIQAVGSDKSSALGNLPVTEGFFKIPAGQTCASDQEVDVCLLPFK